MITNSAGEVALKYYLPTGKYISLSATIEYVFVAEANISLCWVKPEHVDRILAIKKTCCGNTHKPMFRYANETEVRRWTNRGGR